MPLLSCAAHRFRSARFAARLSRRWACAAALRPSESPGPERFFPSQTLLLFCFFAFLFFLFPVRGRGFFMSRPRPELSPRPRTIHAFHVRGTSRACFCACLPRTLVSVRRLSALLCRAVASALASAPVSRCCFGAIASAPASRGAFRACFARRVLPQFQEIVILRSFIAQSVR